MADVPFEDPFEEMWGVPDYEGPVHARPLSDWLSRSKSMLPACRHWREPVGLLHEVVVFASAWFDRPMTGRGVDMSWPDVGFYLDGSWSAGVLVCSPGFRPPFVQRPRSQIVVYPWPDLGAPRDPRRFARALRWLLGQASEGRRVEIGCAGDTAGPGPRSPGCSCCRGCRRARRSVGSGAPTARRPSNRGSRKPSCATSLGEPADRRPAVAINPPTAGSTRGRRSTMTSLYLWHGNEAIVCTFHRTPSHWDYEPLSAIETHIFVRMLRAESLARVSPCEPCELGYGGKRPRGPLTFAEALLTA